MKKAEPVGGFVKMVVEALGGPVRVATMVEPILSPTTVRTFVTDNEVRNARLLIALADAYAKKMGGSRWAIATRLVGRI